MKELIILKYIYDANLFVCPFCFDSWYVEENNKYKVLCRCGYSTLYYSSKEEAESEWYKIIDKNINRGFIQK